MPHGHKKSRIIISSSLILLVLLCMIVHVYNSMHENNTLKAVSTKVDDSSVIVEWHPLSILLCEYIKIDIYDNDVLIKSAKSIPFLGQYRFLDGKHGIKYKFIVTAHFRKNEAESAALCESLFLDYKQLPDLPLLIINTASGDDPKYEEVKAPDGMWGITQKNNEYVSAEIKIINLNNENIYDKVSIRTRGNTSNFSYKNSYKLKFNSAHSFAGGAAVRSHEWILHNSGTSMKIIWANAVASICNMEWLIDAIPVCLILNGHYKGNYWLTQNVGIESSNGLVDKNGYIFEDDNYWWNADNIYFKTNSQLQQMGFTFKYPKIKNTDDESFLFLKNYMQEFTDLLVLNNSSYRDYINETSFAKWLLVRELTGNSDGAGANRYYYMKNPDSKVQMGPIWDNDNIFKRIDSTTQSRINHLVLLFQQESFQNIYRGLWQQLSENFFRSFSTIAYNFYERYKIPLDESFSLEEKQYGVKTDNLERQLFKALSWFCIRCAYMDIDSDLVISENSRINVEDFQKVKGELKFSVDSSEMQTDMKNNGYKKVSGWAFTDDSPDKSIFYRIGIYSNGYVYPAVEYRRSDVQDAFGLKDDYCGFTVNIPNDTEICVCIVDLENKLIYL